MATVPQPAVHRTQQQWGFRGTDRVAVRDEPSAKRVMTALYVVLTDCVFAFLVTVVWH